MLTSKTLEFLTELSANNNLEWMRSHKEQYLQAKKEFIGFLQELIFSISEFDSSINHLRPEDLLFRLNRDTRFSRDKTPYNAAFRASISLAPKKPIPAGYYISVKPSASFLGGGIYLNQFPQAINMVREYILQNPRYFQSIINDSGFTDNFVLEGEKLKNVPRGYDKEHPLAEFIKHKSWFVQYGLSDQQLVSGDVDFIAQKFKLMKPLNDFLNEALRDFSS